jgi:O-antigen/teichoic acid export membrane protein
MVEELDTFGRRGDELSSDKIQSETVQCSARIMNRNEKITLLKNAAANVIRGGAAALVAVAVPPFLARMMPPQSYGAWLLVLQLSTLVGYLDFGIQTAVGRFVAHANEKRDPEHRDRVVSTSFVALTLAGAAAIVAAILVAIFLPSIFRQMPKILLGDARLALVLVAGSLAIGLPASVFNGIFIGLQRYEVPAAIIGGSRILSALLVVLVVKRGGSLISMGVVVATVNMASYVLQYWTCRKASPTYQISKQMVSRDTGRELFDYCLGLTVWSFGMLLVGGLDLSLVGYFQFEAVVYYAVVANLITFLAGLQSALFSVMIPSTAVLYARRESRELGDVIVTATRYSTFLLLLAGIPLFVAARMVLSLWVGPAYAVHGAQILQVLIAANIIRLSAVPYVMGLIGVGQQRLVTVTPILEGVFNLLASIIAGYMFGAMGVALGTLFGSLIGISGHLFYNMQRTSAIVFRISDYVRDGLLRPVICALPLIAYVVVLNLSNLSDTVSKYSCFAAALITTGFLIWRWGLVGSERDKVRSWRLAPQA